MSAWQPADVIALAGVVALVVGTIVTTVATLLTAHWRRQDAAKDRAAQDRRSWQEQAAEAIARTRSYAETSFVKPIADRQPHYAPLVSNSEVLDLMLNDFVVEFAEVEDRLKRLAVGHPSADVRRLSEDVLSGLWDFRGKSLRMLRSAHEDWDRPVGIDEALQARQDVLANLTKLTDALHGEASDTKR